MKLQPKAARANNVVHEIERFRNGSSLIREGRTFMVPRDTVEEKVAMCVIEGSKTLNVIGSEDQVAQYIENDAKFAVESVKIDQSNSEDSNVQFEVPLTELESLKQLMHRAGTGVELTKTVLHPRTCLVESSTGTNLINKEYLQPQRKYCIKRLKSPKLKNAKKAIKFKV